MLIRWGVVLRHDKAPRPGRPSQAPETSLMRNVKEADSLGHTLSSIGKEVGAHTAREHALNDSGHSCAGRGSGETCREQQDIDMTVHQMPCRKVVPDRHTCCCGATIYCCALGGASDGSLLIVVTITSFCSPCSLVAFQEVR